MGAFVDLHGGRFGRLIVLVRSSKRGKRSQIYWECICDCGNSVVCMGENLKMGNTKSCGCLKREGNNITHGHTRKGRVSRTYNARSQAITRCYNPDRREYKYYGAIGRTVCARWLESFENFLEDMGECPEGMSLERVDNEGNYCKENCIWATPEVQHNNTHNNRKYEYMGITATVPVWSRITGINMWVLYPRLRRYGWSVEEALTTPAGVRRHKTVDK